ncbi:PatU [Cronbergia sp. UHCC 0137]|uniref:PatU n=1 Tax=Cronbergia sp. UHCC 0137 TaxID=3110239 RepID=UPI002B202B3C|nr:PatU [Cronbergia sp. UHCC 0137]MEA5618874.1 PatU [Cronbergia sp. UHCC 0137]
MNSDSESLQRRLLDWLLINDVKTNEYPTVEHKEVDGVKNHLQPSTASTSSKQELGQEPQTFQLGEIPTVQERYQAVLKRQLQKQIQDHPPLFPWETQFIDYPESLEQSSPGFAWGWLVKPEQLKLPIPLPDQVFQQLVDKCQELLTSSLPLGAKLVQAVENFFDEDSLVINDLAGLVLRSSYRSVEAPQAAPSIESNYTELLPRQQMALSLMAAKQLLENMSLSISPTESVVERQWLTDVGNLSIRVELNSVDAVTKLSVQSQLPYEGVLKLGEKGCQTMVQSALAVNPKVELCCQQSNQTYTLEVEFPELDQQPLLLAINLTI